MSKSYDIDYTEVSERDFPPSMHDIPSWGVTYDGGKMPWFPWADEEYKWSNGDYGTFEDAWEWVEKGVSEHLTFIHQSPDGTYNEHGDPFIFFDFDDVRDPDSGHVISEVTEILSETGATYLSVSSSGGGLHAYYEGELPEGFRTGVSFELRDEPAYDHENPPELEIYDRRRVSVETGDRVRGAPRDILPVDEDALLDICEEHGEDKEEVDRDQPIEEQVDYQRDELADIETTTDYTAITDAIKQVKPRDIRLRSPKTEESSDGRMSWDPVWGPTSKSGTRLGYDPDGPGWIYRDGDVSLDALTIVACEEGIINSHTEDLTGEDFWEAVDELRKRGAHIPKLDREGQQHDISKAARVLLPDYSDERARMGWWARDQTADEAIDQETVYEQTETTLNNIMAQEESAVVWGIMGSGKTYSSLSVAAEREEPVAMFSGRGDLYDQNIEYARECGYEYIEWEDRTSEEKGDIHIMPSMFRDCPSATGEHGDHLADRLERLHHNGASPKMIHALLDLPCEEGDESCPYHQKCEIEPDDYEVIIGHYKHAHLPYITSGRHCVFDENPADAFTNELHGERLVTSVNTFLGFETSPPFDDFNDLIANRDDAERVAQTEAWFDQHELEPDERNVIRHEEQNYNALAPYAVWAILHGEAVEDGSSFHRCHIPNEQATAVYYEGGEDVAHSVRISTPPNNGLRYANATIALDGTPLTLPPGHDEAQRIGRAPEWQMALGRPMEVRRVLSDEERVSFLHDTQGIRIVQTTDAVKPYSSGNYTNWQNDAALLEAAGQVYDHGDPVAITTLQARLDYERQEGAEELVDEWNHYGNVRGSNQYAHKRLGVLLGSPHHGDPALEMRAAMLGMPVDPEGRGTDRDYGNDVGNGLLEEMRESSVAQAALRFGRDGGGAIVLIHTAAIPDWLPVDGQGEVVRTWTKTQRKIVEHLQDGRYYTPAELAEKDDIDVTPEQVTNVLSGFEDRGLVRRRQDPEDGRRVQWQDAGLSSAPIYGETTLPEVDTDDSLTEQVDRVARTIDYTWDSVNRGPDQPVLIHDSQVRQYVTADEAGNGGDPPPG